MIKEISNIIKKSYDIEKSNKEKFEEALDLIKNMSFICKFKW